MEFKRGGENEVLQAFPGYNAHFRWGGTVTHVLQKIYNFLLLRDSQGLFYDNDKIYIAGLGVKAILRQRTVQLKAGQVCPQALTEKRQDCVDLILDLFRASIPAACVCDVLFSHKMN
jgi:hypothetical protein